MEEVDLLAIPNIESSKKKRTERIVPFLNNTRSAWAYLYGKFIAEEVKDEVKREILEMLAPLISPRDPIELELKKLALEDVKYKIELKKQLRQELLPMIKQMIKNSMIQQQLQQQLAACVQSKKRKIIKELKRKGYDHYEIMLKLMDLEDEIAESCQQELQLATMSDMEDLPLPEDSEVEDEMEEGEEDEEDI